VARLGRSAHGDLDGVVDMTTSRLRSSVQTQWMALGGALVVLAGVLVAWALSQAADRVQVVQVAQEVQAGQVITADDLTVTGIAFDSQLQGLVPAGSLAELDGRVAAIDLQPGALVQVGMWRATPVLAPGEQRVGVVLKPGRFPDGIAQGDTGWAASMDPADPAAPVAVRVLDASVTADGATSLTLAVDADAAVTVARLAAAEQLVVVGEPPTVVAGDQSPEVDS
jgi:hypothetical protein